MSQRPVQPAAPVSMHIVFGYVCPSCGQTIHVPAQIRPTQVRCAKCQTAFPIIPVDERSMHFIHIMLDNGRAAADADFI